MESTQIFLPEGIPPKLTMLWRTTFIYPLIAMTIFQLFMTIPMLWHLAVAVFCLLFLFLFLLFFQSDVSVTISQTDRTLCYRYLNCFGVTRQTTVDLPTANVKYKLVSEKYWSNRQQLRLNNGMLKNNVNLLQNPDYGFNAKQLDQMTELISKYCQIKH